MGSGRTGERGARSDDELFAYLYPSLRRFAAAVRPVDADPDDLVQEALTRTLAAQPLTECRDPGAYLRTVIYRLAANQRRSSGRKQRALARLATPDGATPAYPSDLDELRRLAPSDRAVLYLTVVEQRSYPETAAILGCSEEAARTRSSRARKRLRLELADDQDEEVDDA